jgi:O-antigen/teichoic acid export membrane protein
MASDRIELRAAKVSLVNGLSTIMTVGFQLVSVPICLRYWGKESYGTWLALYAAFMLLKSLDGGYTLFIGNKLNYLYNVDVGKLREHLASGAIGILVISSVQMTLVVGALVFEPLANVLGMLEQAHDLSGKLGLVVMIVSWVLTGSYLGIVHRLLIPAGLMYQAAWWAMALQVSQFGAIILAAVFELNMLSTSALFAAVQVLVYVASAVYVRRKLPRFSPWLRGLDVRVGISDLGQSLFLTGSNLIQQGAFNGSVLLVSALGGAISVPIFTTVRTMTNLWTSVTTVLSTPLLPDVVRIHALKEPNKLVAINQAYWVLVGSAVNLGALISYPMIPYFYDQWTAHAVALNGPLLCFLLASVVVANAGALIALHLNGINSLRIVLGASVARATCSLVIGVLGFDRFGLNSFGFGIFVGELVATVATGRFFFKHQISTKTSSAASGFGPVTLGTGAAAIFFLGGGFGAWPVGWIWLLSIIAVLVASVWGWQTLEPNLRHRLKAMVRSLICR